MQLHFAHDALKAQQEPVVRVFTVVDAFLFFFFKQKTAYEMATSLEFRRVLFRSRCWRPGRTACGRSRRRACRSCSTAAARSEERRVGKECRCRWSPYQ